jgi:endonuclease III
MEVKNKKSQEEIKLPEKLIKKLSYNQKLIIESLANHPEGMFSRHLSHKTGISNKSDTIKHHVRELLAKYDLEVRTQRIPEKRQWLWSLNHISSGE